VIHEGVPLQINEGSKFIIHSQHQDCEFPVQHLIILYKYVAKKEDYLVGQGNDYSRP